MDRQQDKTTEQAETRLSRQVAGINVALPDPTSSLPPHLYEKVCIAIGQASTCWSDLESAGDFLTDDALRIANDLAWEIVAVYAGSQE